MYGSTITIPAASPFSKLIEERLKASADPFLVSVGLSDGTEYERVAVKRVDGNLLELDAASANMQYSDGTPAIPASSMFVNMLFVTTLEFYEA